MSDSIVKEEINIANLVNDHVSVEAGVATISDEGLTQAALAVDLDVKEYKRMQKAAALAAAGIVDAVGVAAIDGMVADKNLNNVSCNFKIGHEEWSMGVAREATVNIPGKTGEESKKQVIGSTTVRRKTKVGHSAIGESKKRVSVYGVAKLG